MADTVHNAQGAKATTMFAARHEAVSRGSVGNLIDQPYLSIVMPSRNDDYGGNALRRMQVALSALLVQLEKHRIESELILVDWNPPADKPLLKDVIRWPADRLKYCTVRVIVVQASIHRRYKHSDKIPFNGIVAMNCGIRRGRGQFILPKQMDSVYSEETMAFISSKNLKEDQRYHVDRYDVNRNAIQCNTLNQLLNYCENYVIRINAQDPQEHRRFRWIRNDVPNLHTMASGDFMLMSRRCWHLLHGYFEADIAGAYVDGLLCYASYAAGVREVVLNTPNRIYHIDHDDKFNDRIITHKLPLENWISLPFIPKWANRKIIGLYRRFLVLMGYKVKSSVRGVPTLEYSEYRKMCRQVVTGKRPYIFNDENWGLGGESLEEFIISVADWDKQYAAN